MAESSYHYIYSNSPTYFSLVTMAMAVEAKVLSALIVPQMKGEKKNWYSSTFRDKKQKN